MTANIILGWRTMLVVWCGQCQGWALQGIYGPFHLTSRLSPPAVCPGWDRSTRPGISWDTVPSEHRKRWQERVPRRLRKDGTPVAPNPHSKAWAYLPSAPAEGCSCGYYIAFSPQKVRRLVSCSQWTVPVVLYVQALGKAILHADGARCERYRVLAHQAPRSLVDRLGPGARDQVAAWLQGAFGPELSPGATLPAGVFDRIPPEVAMLLEEGQ